MKTSYKREETHLNYEHIWNSFIGSLRRPLVAYCIARNHLGSDGVCVGSCSIDETRGR